MWVVITGRSFWIEARGAAKHPQIHRTAPTTKNDPTQNVSGAEVEKLWSGGYGRRGTTVFFI